MNLSFQPTGHSFDRGLTARGQRAGDRYVLWLGGALLGYALLSRSFAYLGVPPLFIGEILLVAGLVAVVRAGRVGPLFRQPAAWLMAALVALAAARTLPYVGEHGLDAPRDFMMIGYAAYAVILGGLVVARPERLVTLLEKYRVFAVVMVSAVWLVYLVYKTAETSIPLLPWSGGTRMIEAKGGRISAEVTSAKPLDPAQLSQITAALEKLSGKKVDVVRKEDATLLGGVIAKVGDTVYDGSLRTQLRGLRDELTK